MNSETDSFTADSSNEARDQVDRRHNYFRSFLYSFFMRRRKIMRRSTDTPTNVYVDVHDSSTVFLFTVVIIFCVTDAMLTLFILDNGGKEINPFMNYLLSKDVMMFFWIKFTLTSLGMLFLVSHKYFVFYRFFRGFHLIKTIFALYLTLIVYEVSIIYNLYSA